MARKTELQKQQDIWYKRIKDAGFEEIEYKDGSMKSGLPRALRSRNELDKRAAQATQEYYYMAHHFLNDYKFETELEKTMWTYHSEGLSCRTIAGLLSKTGITKTKKSTVWNILNELEKKMKFLYLLP